MAAKVLKHVLLFFCLTTAVTAAAVDRRSTFKVEGQIIQPELNTRASSICTHVGNSDLYGLGVRLGVYLQLFSTLTANHFLVETSQAAWDTNAVFLVAIFIATVKSSVGSDRIAAFEAFVMVQMLLAFVLAVFTVSGRRWREFDLLVRNSQSRFNGSPLGSFTRSVLTTAIACYQVWFWFRGARQLDRVAECRSSVFLFTRVSVGSGVTAVFKILAVLYLIMRVIRMFWESPAWEFVRSYALRFLIPAFFDLRGGRPNLKEALFEWYRPPSIEESVLISIDDQPILFRSKDEKTSKVDRRPHPTDRLAKDLVLAWHLITLLCSLATIFWSIVAIELTLVWNGASQAYSVSSTGQLIPLTTGIGGVVQLAVALLNQWRSKASTQSFAASSDKSCVSMTDVYQKKNNERPAMKVDPESGTWRYRLFDERTAIFTAKEPSRRWSIDAATSVGTFPAEVPLLRKDSNNHRLAPTLPFLRADQRKRIDKFYGREIHVLWPSARSIYRSRSGRHIFHDLAPPVRRHSFDSKRQFYHKQRLRPHRARKHADIPLRAKREVEHVEQERKKWYKDEVARLAKRWRKEEQGRRWVQPADMDQQSMFSIEEERTYSYRSSARRRYSADDTDWVYPSRRRPLPFLDKSSTLSATPTRSISGGSYYDTSYDTSRSYHDRKINWFSTTLVKLIRKLMSVFGQVAAASVNIICCCAPCTIAQSSIRRRRRRRRFGTWQEVQPERGSVKQAPGGQHDHCMRCEACDEDLFKQSATRQMHRPNLAMPHESLYEKYLSSGRLRQLNDDAGRWLVSRLGTRIKRRAYGNDYESII